MTTTKIYLNTWGAYNDGCIGFGWFTPDEARDFIEESLNNEDFIKEHGEEFFIADIDNYLGVDFGKLEYADIDEVCDTIEELEAMDEDEVQEIIAVMEVCNCDITEAQDKKDNFIIYSDIEAYFDSMDELVECELPKNSILTNYFNYEAYHRDLMFDATEASNGIVLVG